MKVVGPPVAAPSSNRVRRNEQDCLPKRRSFDKIASGILKHPNLHKDWTVTKPELGTKRLCASCGAKFYDLNKDPIHCPKCGAVYEVVVATRPVRPEPAAPVAAPRPPVPAPGRTRGAR